MALAVAVLMTTMAAPAAPPADAPGCRDAPLLQRLPGCTIRECRVRDYDEAELQSGPVDATGEFPKSFVDGETWIVTYACPAQLGLEAIARQAQAQLRRGGFSFVYSGSMFYGDLPGFTARKGDVWIQLVSEPFEPHTGYTVTVVRRPVAALPRPPARPSPRPQPFPPSRPPRLKPLARRADNQARTNTQSIRQHFASANLTGQLTSDARFRLAYNNSYYRREGLLPTLDGTTSPLANLAVVRVQPDWALSASVDYTPRSNLVASVRGGLHLRRPGRRRLPAGPLPVRQLEHRSGRGSRGIPARLGYAEPDDHP